MSLGKDILKEIKKDKLEPKAKWIFVLKNLLAWSLGILSLVISSLSVSVIINIINNNDYPLFRMMHPAPLRLIVQTLPYFWIIGMIIFVIVFRYTLKQTKDGYKIEVYKIIIISVVLNILLGSFFYAQGIGNNIDSSFSHKSPFYEEIMASRKKLWLQEDQGMLSGKIISITDQNNFNLEDFNKKQWKIIIVKNKITAAKFKRITSPKIDLELGLEIRTLGEKINKDTFHAFIIKPAPSCSCSSCSMK
jgi:hypothetical protein